jgi:hypothetical protein
MAAITNVNINNRTISNTSSTNFRTLVAKTTLDNIWNDNQLFFFASKEATPSGLSADSLGSNEKVYENIVLMERVTPDDVSLVAPRVDWKANTVYDSLDTSINLYEYSVSFDGVIQYKYKPYVMTDDYNVYLCIKNSPTGLNRDRVASTIKPTTVGTDIQRTADGYEWKYVFSVNDSQYKFLTQKWIPVPRKIKSIPTDLNKSSATYRQFQVQEKAKTTAGGINDVVVDIGVKNVYFDMPEPRTEVIGQGSGASIKLSTAFEAGKGYKLTGYRIINSGTGYVGGKFSFIDSPNSNGDITTKTSLENKISLATSYGGIEKDLGSDPSTALQAKTLMFVGNMRETDDTLGSFPSGVTMSAFGLISNPVYAVGNYAGSIAGAELGNNSNKKLNLRQAIKTQIKDNSGAGFTLTTAERIQDNRLKFNSVVDFTTSKTDATVIDLMPFNFTGSGNSNRANLFITGAKTLPVAGETMFTSAGVSFEIEQVFPSTLRVGSGDLLYIVPVMFNIILEQLYTTRFIIPL